MSYFYQKPQQQYQTGTLRLVWGYSLLTLGLLTSWLVVGLPLIPVALWLVVTGHNQRVIFLRDVEVPPMHPGRGQ